MSVTIFENRCYGCQMKNYAVIGGSSGIGKELANRLSQSGNKVYATYNVHKPENVKNHIEYHHLNVLASDPDLSFLPSQLDGLVYCPGNIDLKPFGRFKPDEFTRDFELQVGGAIKVLQASLLKLKSADEASIVLFSTVAVQTGFPFHTKVAASKGAVEGLTRALAAELAPKIRVNAIAPSISDTPMAAGLLSSIEKKEANAQRHPLKRIGSAEDIAAMAAFLLSSEARWITGQVIHVDGGISSIKN